MNVKMTHQEYVLQRMRRIKEAIEGTLKGTVDIAAACHIIINNWHEADLPEDNDEYLFFTGIHDEFEQFSPDSRELNKPLAPSQMSQEEKEILDYYKDHIINACKNTLEKYFP